MTSEVLTGDPVEIKNLSSEGEFEGYAAVFGNTDAMGDVIEPGSFKKTLRGRKTLPLLWQHNFTQPIGTLRAREDNKGLFVKGSLTLGVELAREALALARDRAVQGLSIGFFAQQWKIKGDTRHLSEIDLLEGSMVTFPANPLSLITDVKQWSRKDYERALRGLGFSRRKAEGLAGNGWAAMGRRQAAPRNGAGSEPEDSPAETAEFIQRINELTGLFK